MPGLGSYAFVCYKFTDRCLRAHQFFGSGRTENPIFDIFIEQHRPQFMQRSLYQPVLVRMPLVSGQRLSDKMSNHAVLFMK